MKYLLVLISLLFVVSALEDGKDKEKRQQVYQPYASPMMNTIAKPFQPMFNSMLQPSKLENCDTMVKPIQQQQPMVEPVQIQLQNQKYLSPVPQGYSFGNNGCFTQPLCADNNCMCYYINTYPYIHCNYNIPSK